MRWLSTLACVLGLAAAVPAVAAETVPADERTTAYRDFRAAFDAGNFTTALPLASQVVDLTRNQYGAEAQELVNPLSNLATTYLRMREFGMALDTYRQALTLLELQADATNPRFVRPLHGSGAALRGLNRDSEAITPLKRAVDITRNRDGLHAVAQLPILKQLIECYVSAGRFEDAGREQQYAYTLAENTYGRNDLRLLPELDSYARWNEAMGRYSAARVLHARAIQIADAAKPDGTEAVSGMRGMARTIRLAFIHGESEEAANEAGLLSATLKDSALMRVVTVPSGEGERMLRAALQRVDAATPAQPALRGEILLDLGDWYLTAGVESRALSTYRDAWRELALTNGTQVLTTPVMIVYRAPNIAVSRRQMDPDSHEEKDVELRLSISATGNVRDATVANPAPERESAERAVVQAVKRATWRPAFENGEPVAVTDFVFRERVFVRPAKTAG